MNTIDIVNSTEPRFVIKRSGDKVPFEEDKIKNAILNAMQFLGIIRLGPPMLMKFMTWWKTN